jgi:hypothetical protein
MGRLSRRGGRSGRAAVLIGSDRAPALDADADAADAAAAAADERASIMVCCAHRSSKALVDARARDRVDARAVRQQGGIGAGGPESRGARTRVRGVVLPPSASCSARARAVDGLGARSMVSSCAGCSSW